MRIMFTIILIDDDPAILEMVTRVLEKEGYSVLQARSGSELFAIIKHTRPDLFLMDIGLPRLDGIRLCEQLRRHPQFADTPILFLTGQDATESAARALNAGGDDYIRKPFAVRELTARLRAHLRRFASNTIEDVPIIRFAVDRSCQVFINETPITLTRVEFELLQYLCMATEEWHSTQDLLSNVWNYPQNVGDAALVRNHIRNLRRKIEDNPDRPNIILSRHGRGYIVRARIEGIAAQN